MLSSSPDDLLARFRAGDREAFEVLIEQLGGRLKGFFLRQGAQPATAEDLVQDVFLRIYQSSSRYTASGRLDAYFFRVARNLWIDRCRRKKPAYLGDDMPIEEDASPSPLDLADVADRAAQLRALVDKLDEPAKTLLDLAVFQELPYSEVSEILGVPVGTIKSRVFYTLKRLREQASHLSSDDASGG